MHVLFSTLIGKVGQIAQSLQHTFCRWTQPASTTPIISAVLDLSKTKQQLVVENAFLRQQLIVLHRQVKHPKFNSRDRFFLVAPAALVQTWKHLLLIAQPDTLLRWHRRGFRLLWKRKSKAKAGEPRIPAETIVLIQHMARDNPLWGAERSRGELLKLNIKLAKRTIQKYR